MTKYIIPLLPALLAFGPVFMVIGLQPGGMPWISYLGALMTSIGALGLFALVGMQAQALHRLRQNSIEQRDEADQDLS